ncbi:MAG: hypothetical protein SGPRY_004437 [Prymnesium sp.]
MWLQYAPSLSSVLYYFASAIMFLRSGVYVDLTIGNSSTKDRKRDRKRDREKTKEEFDADMRELFAWLIIFMAKFVSLREVYDPIDSICWIASLIDVIAE